jgi:hypothetical protein
LLSLISTGTPLPPDTKVESPPLPASFPNLRLLFLLCLVIPAVTCLVIALFVFDPDAGTLTLDTGDALMLGAVLFALIVLPLVAAGIFWRELRRQRRPAS